MPRQSPIILITGTPGVGKTTTASEIASLSADTSCPLTHLSINDIIKTKECHDGYDERLKTHIVDEDKMLDEVEKVIEDGEKGGFILDYHEADIFPDRWVDLVVVLRCSDTTVFHDRLAKGGRGYEGDKLNENIDAEIFGVIRDEAVEGFPGEGRVVELESVSIDDVEGNCERILEWVANWVKEKRGSGE